MIDYNKLVSTAIKKTTNKDMHWDSIFDYTHTTDDLGEVELLIFENEFHQVNIVNSYISHNDGLVFVLIDETFESGKNGHISLGPNLYVSQDIHSDFTPILAERELLTNLENIVSQQIYKMKSTPEELNNLKELENRITEFMNEENI